MIFFFQDMNSGMQVVASYHELFNLLNEDSILILANYMQVLNFLCMSKEARSLVLLLRRPQTVRHQGQGP